MSLAFSDDRTIAAPVSAVWAALTDWGRAPSWMPGVESMRSSGPLTAGTELSFTARGKDRTSRIVECRPNAVLTLDGAVGGVRASYRYTLEPVDATLTRVSLAVDVATTGAVRLLGPVIRASIAKADGVQLTQLKRLLEEEG